MGATPNYNSRAGDAIAGNVIFIGYINIVKVVHLLPV
jgi:hypothetical protein